MKLIIFLAGIAVGTMVKRASSARAMHRHPLPATTGQDPQALAGGSVERGVGGFDSEEPIQSLVRTDDQVRERITSRMQRTVQNPGAIQVEVKDGCVTLRGQIQAKDTILLMAEIEGTAGVTSVRNELDVQGSLEEIAPPMTREKPAVRAAEAASSHMS
jgi:osmotically-inducible protein OsmY